MFMGNGSPKNGGCEAITKGTLEILNKTFPQYRYLDSYFNYEYKSNEIDRTETCNPIDYPKRWTIKWIILQLLLRFSERLTAKMLFSTHKKYIKKSDVVLSLGGDNYSLDYGIPRRFVALGNYVKLQGSKYVIWGASIGPFEKDSAFEHRVAEHFKHDVDLIFVREEVSKEYLSSIGVNDNVYVVADPAFMMKTEECSSKVKLPEEYICINFSDLMAKYVTGGDIDEWIKICAETIDKLFEHNKKKLVFIPHVKADYEFCNKILPLCKYKDKVILVSKELNAAEMKWIISKSICNIACRTHSTIASFSTGVPTISLGYSIKSKGLNVQMYGHEDFLVYKENITPENIISCVKKMFADIHNIKEELSAKSVVIKEEACMAGEILLKYLTNE